MFSRTNATKKKMNGRDDENTGSPLRLTKKVGELIQIGNILDRKSTVTCQLQGIACYSGSLDNVLLLSRVTWSLEPELQKTGKHFSKYKGLSDCRFGEVFQHSRQYLASD